MRKTLCLLLGLCLLFPSASAAEKPKFIALTFDDGPSGRYTRQLLEGLDRRDARVTFFLCGYRIEQYPDLPEQILERGHEIGLHGYSHNIMSTMSRRDIAQELNRTLVLLPPNCRVRFLRPPQGRSSLAVRQVAGAMGFAIADWSVDPKDWATQDTAAVGRSILEDARDGDVVLMHDMSQSSVEAALNIIDLLQRRGFRFVTLSELARLRGVPIRDGETYRQFPAPGDS